MTGDEPISAWLRHLQAGDEQAAEKLFWTYFDKLVTLARSQLQTLPRRAEDEEDAAQSALKSYFRGVAAGRFKDVQDRDGLWRLLATITIRKVVARHRRFHAQKRPNTLDEAALTQEPGTGGGWRLDYFPADEPTPHVVAEFLDELQSRLQQLPNDEFRQLALLKLEGYTNREIADRLGTYQRKVERRLAVIRLAWSANDSDQSGDPTPPNSSDSGSAGN